MLAERLRDAVRVTGGGDDGVPGRQRGLGQIDAQAPAGAGDEPNLLLFFCMSCLPFERLG